MNTSETLLLVGDVVFVLLGEAGTSEQVTRVKQSRHGDEPWKHRSPPPPWHHHKLHTDIKGSASSRGETVSRIVLRFFVDSSMKLSLIRFADIIANTHDATRPAERRFDVTNQVTGLDLVEGKMRSGWNIQTYYCIYCITYLHY